MLNFPASVPGIGYHNWQAAVTPTSTIAHKGMVAGSKVLAGTILDLLTRAGAGPGRARRVREGDGRR